MAEKCFKEESKACLAEITAYSNLIDTKAFIYNCLAETADVFLAILDPDGTAAKATCIRHCRDCSRSPSPVTYWQAT